MALQLGPVLGKLGGAEVEHATIPAGSFNDISLSRTVPQGDYLVAAWGEHDSGMSGVFVFNGVETKLEASTWIGGCQVLHNITQIELDGYGNFSHRGLDVYWVKLD